MEWAKLPSPAEENPWRAKNVEIWMDRVGIGHFTW
jgi:hypothetical protein